MIGVVGLEPYSFDSTKHHDFAGRGACVLHDPDDPEGMVFVACHLTVPFDYTSRTSPLAPTPTSRRIKSVCDVSQSFSMEASVCLPCDVPQTWSGLEPWQ